MPFWTSAQDVSVRDPRILKAQLALAIHSVRLNRISNPLWALVVAVLCSGGVFGDVPWGRSLFLPLTISVVICIGTGMVWAYTRSGARDAQAQSWLYAFIAIHGAASMAWGLMPWLCWEPGNEYNHLFLAAAAMTVLAGLMAVRGSSMAMYVGNMIPLVVMHSLRFLISHNPSDIALGILGPFIALQFWYTGRPWVLRMIEDSRLRFEVEDLARALEEARDDALHKRFEAEAANASKTAFLANMSHELRTPLNAILGFSEIIAQETFGPVGAQRYRDYAADIHASGAHLLSLINDLLDVSKIEAGRMDIAPHALDATNVFATALKLIGAKAREKNQRLAIVVEDSAPALWADERAVKQILINLVSNAVKFTPHGGRIDVIASRAVRGDFQILVRDNGPGITPDKLDKIFMPFNQVDNRFDRQAGGTGLGLALVRGLAELHGGRAWMESEFGKGCSVFVTLPVRDRAGA